MVEGRLSSALARLGDAQAYGNGTSLTKEEVGALMTHLFRLTVIGETVQKIETSLRDMDRELKGVQ